MVAKLVIGGISWLISMMAWGLTDPTRPSKFDEHGHVTMTKEGAQMVLVSPGRQTALVDGRYVSVGDQLKRGEVVSISDKGVEVYDPKKGTVSILSVMDETIKIKHHTKVD